MKRILGLDLGTNSIGWALVNHDIDKHTGEIINMGSRIIPMSQEILGKFDAGQSVSQTAERTQYRGIRRLYQRDNLRRERLHRVLNILGFIPEHYKKEIDFEKKLGQFKPKKEPKINYKPLNDKSQKHEFIFKESFLEMVEEFKSAGQGSKIPYDWTIYFLRKKALKEKITEQELAWVLLNFNAKRGYYQLRGEEEEISAGKEKAYEVLVGEKAVENGDTLKTGEKLYDLYFTNGWKYDKPIAKPDIWIDKTREFIVTTSTLKSGEIKRSYKSVNSEEDWIAIKEKTQNEIEEYNDRNNTVGVANYIFDALLKNPKQKIRGKLIKTIERKYYKKELEQILDTQIQLQPDLFSDTKYEACIEELYPKNKAHKSNVKDKDFKYLFVEDVIFYQRPLRSQKSNISGCQYEYRAYKKFDKETGKHEIIKEPIKAIPKSHPLYQEFRLWQFIRNLEILQKQATVAGKPKINHKVTGKLLTSDEEYAELFDFISDKKEINQKQILQHFVKAGKILKNELDNYRWNYPEEKKYPANETKAQILTRLKKVSGKPTLSDEQIIALWHIIYSVRDPKEFQQALNTFADKNSLDKESFVAAFKKFPPFDSDYGAYSLKAIKKILPLMRQGKYWDEKEVSEGVKNRITEYMERVKDISVDKNHNDFKDQVERVSDDDIPKQLVKSFIPFKDKNPYSGLNTYQACYAVYERHSEVSDIQIWKTPNDIDRYLSNFKQHSLRNPIVEQVVTETLRTVRDIWNEYGDFDEIHVELARELKNPAGKREEMSKRISENENTNYRIKQILGELMNDGMKEVRPYSPSQQEILKIYEEGVWKNPDTNFSKVDENEIEKIRKNNAPSKNDIKRYKLWLEQGYVSPYTGETISLSDLFSTDYQIEHIIPQSRFFDDSLSNKIICESEVNALKGNQTAYEFIKNYGGQTVNLGQNKTVEVLRLPDYEQHCKRYFSKNRTKLKKILTEDIPESFIERQMNDTRYISKFVKGLLGNIVRQEGEKEATTKNLVTVSGAVTSELKQDWGLNDIWNKLILPRFERLNKISGDTNFTSKNTIGITIPDVPDEISKGFSKKRIDHRHHALDALVITCTTKDHINYITSLNTERKNYSLVNKLRHIKERQITDRKTGQTKTVTVAGDFKKPWDSFTQDAKSALETTIISFKHNLRVINRTNNKISKWVKQKDGSYKKELVKQKGKNFAIRKPMHKETVSGKVRIRDKKNVYLKEAVNEKLIIVDKRLNHKIKKLRKEGLTNKEIVKFFKDRKYLFNEEKVNRVEVYYFFEATATRMELNEDFKAKHLEAVTDAGIKKILENHLQSYLDEKGKPQFKSAFDASGIEELNKNIKTLNNGKNHKPIYKVRVYEKGNKYPVSQNENSPKSTKYVEAAKGTNLFFAIYWDEEKQKRVYETLPLNEVIEHQKQTAHLPVSEKTEIPVKPEKGKFLFSLSPNDLVYVPTDDEKENPKGVDFKNLSKKQAERIYKMEKASGTECYFIRNDIASLIKNYDAKSKLGELGSQNKYITTMCDEKIKIVDFCWKIKVTRLGKITGAERGE